jgi:hypothetical protein
MTINQSSDSLVTEKPFPKIVAEEVPQEGVQGQSSTHGRSLPSVGSESALKATHSSDSAKSNSVHGQPSVALGSSTEDGQTTVRPPLPSGAEQREAALPEIDGNASDNQATLAPSLPHGTEAQETPYWVIPYLHLHNKSAKDSNRLCLTIKPPHQIRLYLRL